MEYFLFFAVIVMFFMIIKYKNENNSLKKTINNLEQAVRDLYDKVYYSYDEIKRLNSQLINENMENRASVNVSEKVMDTRESADATVPQNTMNTQEHSFSPNFTYGQNYQSNVNQGVPPVIRQQEVYKENIPVKTYQPVSQIDEQPTSDNDNTAAFELNQDTAVPAQESSENPLPVSQYENIQSYNNQRQNSPAYSKKHDGTKQLKSFENWLGTRLFNVVASLMIFIGLVLFCMLGYEYITDTMKMAAMFVVSGSFIALGAFFTRKNKSVFSLGLTGCGFGAFFISILLSHVYFHALNDISAFSMLLVWSSAALVLSKKLNSVTLSVTAHMGTAVSICFAFSYGFSADRIILPVVYQLAAIAVIILGNIFCCKKTYRFGLFMSMLLLVYTTVVMCTVFSSSSVMPGTLSTSFTVMIFSVQFAAISFVSYLITISTAALEKENLTVTNISDLLIIAQIINNLLWTAGTISAVGVVSGIIMRNSFGVKSLVVPTLAVCAAELGHIIVTLLMSEKLNFNEKLSRLSFWFNSVVIMTALFVQSTTRETLRGVPFVFVYVYIVMFIIRLTKNRRLNHLVSFLIGCEMAFMILYGYTAVSYVVISILYMAAVGITALLHWFMQSEKSREKRFTFIKLTEYLWLSFSIIPINVSQFSNISLPLILIEFAILNIIAYFFKYGRDNELALKLTVRIESVLTVYASLLALMFNSSGSLGDNVVIKIIFILFSLGLTAIYIKEFAVSNKTILQVLSAATLSAFFTALCIGFADSNKLAELYVFVLKCKPFFFITAAAVSIIYYINRNHKIRIFLWTVLGIDALLMMFFGYHELFEKFSYDKALFTISVIICIAHSVMDGLMLYYTWELKEDHLRDNSLTIVKAVEYFWMNFSAVSLCIGIISEYPRITNDIVFAVLALINVIILASKYHHSNKSLRLIITVCANILLYICIAAMSIKIYSSEAIPDSQFIFKYSVRFALILLSLGIYYLISREIIKIQSVLIQAYIGLTATLIVNSACRGLLTLFTIQYIFSIVTMITALICIFAGFAAKTKGLRVYGLIVVMICVIKLVTFDVEAADSLSRVAAFVVSGIVCFIISGIYNKVESKLLNNVEAQKVSVGDNVNTESLNEHQEQ